MKPVTVAPVETDDTDDRDIEVVCNVDRPPLIPEGDYELGFVRVEEMGHLWGGRKKLFLHFRICEPGPFFGTPLYMAVNLPSHGRFAISSKYLQQWAIAAGKQPARRDRLSTKVFRSKVFLGHVKTVKKYVNVSNGKIMERDPTTFYSVLSHLIELRAG